MADDDLSDFDTTSFAHDGKERTVYRKGSGPAVIVIAEMPGISPKVAGFARKVAGQGLTAVMPHLFGRSGYDPSPSAHGALAAARNGLETIVPVCISREFTVFATGKTSFMANSRASCWISRCSGVRSCDV